MPARAPGITRVGGAWAGEAKQEGSSREEHPRDRQAGGSVRLPAAMTRSPHEAPTPRMAALARLPIFLALEGKRAILGGGSAAAAWKAEVPSAGGGPARAHAPSTSQRI